MAEPDGSLTQRSVAFFLQVEHAIHIALGALLSVAATVALVGATAILVTGLPDWRNGEPLLLLMDRLLFVLMLAEILHTVRVSIRSGVLTGEPFLVVGLIASIRRVLVITLESSQATQNNPQSAMSDGAFQASMIELGVLAVLILVMVIAIYILRRSAAAGPEHTTDDGSGSHA